MNSTLGLTESGQSGNGNQLTPDQTAAQAGRVKTLGIIALILALTFFIPVLGLFGMIISLILSKKALRISRENLVPIENEKPAYIASIISTTGLILSGIGLLFLLLKS